MRELLRDKERLEHIATSIDNIARYTKGKTYDDLLADDMMCYAVVYNILSIGEATYHLTYAFRKEHPDTPWNLIMRMRNILAHDYYKLKLQTVWEVVEHDLPPLREQVARYLAETDWNDWENNEVRVKETVVHKSLVQTARRMKQRDYDINEICKITGLSREEIDEL